MSEKSVLKVRTSSWRTSSVLRKTLDVKFEIPLWRFRYLLPVIPELKITDKGLVDVNQFKIVPLFGEE